jgi:DNA-binding beta-propeller fold protein YncE
VTELSDRNGVLVRHVITGRPYGFDQPAAIAIAGSHVWVANFGSNTVTELNTNDGSLVRVFGGRHWYSLWDW